MTGKEVAEKVNSAIIDIKIELGEFTPGIDSFRLLQEEIYTILEELQKEIFVE
jgi:hypothetical protein